MIDKEKEIAVIKKQLKLIRISTIPADILAGLALFGLFAADGKVFIEILKNKEIDYLLLAIGLIISISQTYRFFCLQRKLSALVNNN